MIHPAKVLKFACLASLACCGLASPTIAQTSPSRQLPSDLGSTYASPPKILESGDRGEDVEILQQQLQGLGYYDGPIDGIYGRSTAAGVESFQQQVNLPTTGSLDPATWQQLRSPTPSNNLPSEAAGSLPDPVEVPGAQAAAPEESAPQSDSSAPAAGANSPDNGDSLESPPPAEADPEPVDSPGEAVAVSRLWFGVAFLGLLAALIGIGTAIALWLRLRHVTAELNAVEHYPPAESPLLSAAAGSLGLSPQPPAEEASQLSRINIVDELATDLQSTDPSIRHKAIWELGQRGHSAAVQPLVDIFLDADSKERSLILAALSEVGIHTLKPMNRALALSLQDANPEVRKNAIRDLTRLYELMAQVTQLLSHAAQDSSPEVQDTARWALGQLGQIRLIANPAINPSAVTPERQPDSPSQLP